MKKFTIFAALCALLLGSCAENNLDSVTPENNITLPDLTACFADEQTTKTYVEESKYLRWHEADLITAFYGNALNRQYKFKGKTGANSGTFSLVPSGELGTGNELGAIYAVYPYEERATITDEGTMTINLPAVQTYAENSFGKGANTMIAVTENLEDTFLGFKNACGYLKLKLYGEDVTLASVEVKGNNGEKIAGSATATMEFGGVPTLAMNNDATTTVTLDCGEGVVLGTSAETAAELWIVLPETTFEGGITITAINTNGNVFEKSTTKTVAIVRNEIQPMAALLVEFVAPKPANNEIWYTTTDGSKQGIYCEGEEFASDWRWSVGSYFTHYYDETNSVWVLRFYETEKLSKFPNIDLTLFGRNDKVNSVIMPDCIEEITGLSGQTTLRSIELPASLKIIGRNAFNDCTALEGIEIPDGVTSIGEYAFYGCNNIKNLTIPDGVSTIYTSSLPSLNSLTIGANVTSIQRDDDRYYGYFTIYCKPTTPPSGLMGYKGLIYEDVADFTTIYVPSGCADSYTQEIDNIFGSHKPTVIEYDF